LICTSCGTENEAGRKFCSNCGTRLASACPVCGTVNAATAKFCGECGHPLAIGADAAASATWTVPQQPAPAAPVAERRLVSVLFTDLVGFTTISEQHDAEDMRELLSTYFETAREIVDRHGGVIEKFIGDAVMAVWGTPTAHEDDAERAVRTALELVAAVGSMVAGDQPLQARAGVLTGEAAVTIGATGQGMVAGDLVNTASRLQSVAAPGTVLVGEATHRAASGAIDFEPAGEHALKGKEAPVPAWQAIAVVARRRGEGRHEILEPPFVGRDEELRQLKEQFHATAREGKPRLVTIAGQAGIGKSRLGWELEKYLDGVVEQILWHEGRSPAYGEGISYWALAEMLRGRAGIAESDDPATARARLIETLEEYVPDDAERRWIEPRLTGLLGLDELPSESREELFAAWRAFFERMADQAPLLLVFWDLQWADQGLLDFIEHLLAWSRSSPIFVLGEARPELFDRRAGWGMGVRSATLIHLEPLQDAEMRQLLNGLVPGLPEQAVRSIVERAEGIPLYAVETLRMLIDRGALHAEDGRYALSGQLPDLAVPETLHALIAARLDALVPGDRALVTDASVLGHSFTVPALRALADQEADAVGDGLDRLVRHELLVLDADPRSPERGQYKFLQGVVREVAYQSLAKRERRAKHLAAARYFEALGEDELAGVLANHYLAAFRATSPGPEADALAAQARVALRAAAERAANLHASVGALAYLEQALEVTTDPHDRAALHERAAQVATVAARVPAALEHANAALQIFDGMGDRLGVLRARTLEAWILLSEHADRRAAEILEPALASVSDLPREPEVARAEAQLARTLMVAGSPTAITWADRVLATPDLVGAAEIVEVLVTKGTSLIEAARFAEAEVILRGAIAVADRAGDLMASLRARNNLLGVVEEVDLAESRRINRETYDIAHRFAQGTWIQQAIGVGRRLALDTGDWDDWEEEMRAEEADSGQFYRTWFESTMAERLIYRGDATDAERLLREHRMREEVQRSVQSTVGNSAALADALIAQGRWSESFEIARQAWGNREMGRYPILSALFAAAGGGAPDRLAEVALPRLTSGPDTPTMSLALNQTHAVLSSLLDSRWEDARRGYLEARRTIEAFGHHQLLARLQLAVAQLAADRFPAATEAGEAAASYFHARGADGYVAAYRANAFRPTAPMRPSGAAIDAARQTEPTNR
jgi:class 3 adenylate cyclase